MVMNNFFYISLLISSSVLHLEINSQSLSDCPDPGTNLTNGVTAMLNTASDRELLSIRVTWRIKSEYSGCQFTFLRVELNNDEVGKNINVTDGVAYFNNEQLECNRLYIPRVRATYISSVFTTITDNGIPVHYRSERRAPPSQLLRVCIGPPTSLADWAQGRVNISWDPLPCHLQNGADVTDTDYIIQYTSLTTGVPRNISVSDTGVDCLQESGGPYSCVVAPGLRFTSGITYSFQVAAQNIYGVGSFSNPVIARYLPLDTICTLDIKATIYTPTGYPMPANTTVLKETNTLTTSNSSATDMKIDIQHIHSDLTGWIVMGSLVAIVAVPAGVVITILLIIIYMLWKRLNKIEKEQALQHNESADKIDMKECSAYGQVTSTQLVTEQPHFYESTT